MISIDGTPLCRHFGLRLRELETGLLSRQTPRQGLPQTLRDAPERSRSQLHVPPVAFRVDARKLGEGDARWLCVRLQGAHADYAPFAAEGVRVHADLLQ